MNKTLAYLVVLLLLLNVLDLITTHQALAMGAVEVNPLLNWAFDRGHGGLVKMSVVAIGVIVTAWRTRRYPAITKFYTRTYKVLCALYSLIIINNIVVILLLRQGHSI